jgi:AcrR family transcriptional regulator
MPDTPHDDRRKPPRRTAERILATALDLFNRRGEPNVSTTLISAELHISPGNLYYHFPAKDELINALMTGYEQALDDTLASATERPDECWQLLPALLQLAWRYRFLFRDLNDLLARNRLLETRCQAALERQRDAIRVRVATLQMPGRDAQPLGDDTADTLATTLLLLLTYWLSFEYVRDPRQALEPQSEADVLERGRHHLHTVLAPYLGPQVAQVAMAATTAPALRP